ncbi:MAG: polysaccharide deacetylase family protein [Candidatus Dormibacteraceae bacterium]
MLSSVRAAAVLLTVLATGYLLQLSEHGAVAQAPLAAPQLVIAAQPQDLTTTASGHEYFLARLEVVPVGRRNITLPILMYHYIRTPPSMRSDWMGYKLSVSPADFTTQMDWLLQHGYHPIDFNDVRAYFAGGQPLPANPIVITFDDGYADLYTTAYPILAAHGFKAVAYIVSSFVGRPRYVSAQQVVQMDNNGIEIASHTVCHANLARLSNASVLREVVDSKSWLEHLLGHPVVDFAYPSGMFNRQVVTDVMLAGYDTAVTTMSSVDHSAADRYVWPRVRVAGGESLAEFAKSLGHPMPTSNVMALDIETAENSLPPLARPTLQLPR